MPAENTTLIHYYTPRGNPVLACREYLALVGENYTTEHGKVTCFACRNTEVFKAEQLGGGGPTPLKDVIAGDPELAAINRIADEMMAKAEPSWYRQHKNERGMYVIEEFIHHGDYRSTRRVEVYDITPVTVDAVLISSAYCYGSWLDPHGPYPEARRPKLFELVEDLKHGRTNISIGWSTFRLLTIEDH